MHCPILVFIAIVLVSIILTLIYGLVTFNRLGYSRYHCHNNNHSYSDESSGRQSLHIVLLIRPHPKEGLFKFDHFSSSQEWFFSSSHDLFNTDLSLLTVHIRPHLTWLWVMQVWSCHTARCLSVSHDHMVNVDINKSMWSGHVITCYFQLNNTHGCCK